MAPKRYSYNDGFDDFHSSFKSNKGRRHDDYSSLPRRNSARKKMRDLEQMYASPTMMKSKRRHHHYLDNASLHSHSLHDIPSRKNNYVSLYKKFQTSDSCFDYNDLHNLKNKKSRSRSSDSCFDYDDFHNLKNKKSRSRSSDSCFDYDDFHNIKNKKSRSRSKRRRASMMHDRSSSKKHYRKSRSQSLGRPSSRRQHGSKSKRRKSISYGDISSRSRGTNFSSSPAGFISRTTTTKTSKRGSGKRPAKNGHGTFNQGTSTKLKEHERTPQKTLVLIWFVVLVELSFDLATTVIAFRAMLEEDDCCGYEMNLGPLPMSVATPFVLLICVELAFLIHAVILSVKPSLCDRFKDSDTEKGPRSWFECLCCCLKWNVFMLLKGVNVLVLLNPFFGCIIAWMLLYQSDRSESFYVLGLEAGSIILHFISIWLEGSCRTTWQFLLHCLPLVPFAVSVILVVMYLKQEGVCYVVEKEMFQFNGCELCPDGMPPIGGLCITPDGKVPFNSPDMFQLNTLNGLVGKSSNQQTFCDDEYGLGVNFCFFRYEDD